MKTFATALCFVLFFSQSIIPVFGGELTVEIFNTNVTKELISYGGSSQDLSGAASIEDQGLGLRLTGNTWKAIDLSSIDISAGTILKFDFSSKSKGEIHGIGFGTNLGISETHTFKTYGSQVWGISDYNDYHDSETVVKSYNIPVGQFYTGSFRYLFFVCDQDTDTPSAETFIGNIRVAEFQKADLGQTISEAEGALALSGTNLGTGQGQYSPALIENLTTLLEQAKSTYDNEVFDSGKAILASLELENAIKDFNAGVQATVLTGEVVGALPSYTLSHQPGSAFDGKLSTYYQYFTQENGYVGIDLGEGNETALTSIRYFPRGDQLNRLKANKFQGSLDGLTYVDLYEISEEAQAEWTEVNVVDTTAYRYYRYYDVVGSADWSSIAEIEFKGFAKQNLHLKHHETFTFLGNTDNQPFSAVNLTAAHGSLLPELITYKVLTLPTNGTLSLAGETLLLNSTFTQEDLNQNLLTYSSDESLLDDSFSVEVSDTLSGLLEEVIIDITIDSDLDGLTDSQEISLGTDHLNADTDGDGLLDGWEQDNSLDPSLNNSSPLSVEINGENGLTASYNYGAFSKLSDFVSKSPAKVEKVSSINFPAYYWNEFANSGVKDYVGAKFTGYLYVPIEGNYKFALTSDDGSRLYIDGIEVLMNDGLHSAKTIENTINLSAGFHKIKCEYFEKTGSQVCMLQWAGPNRALEIIPASFYFLSLDEHQAEIDRLDADQDGLVDTLEETEGTDPNNPDSDGDRLLDGEEYHAMYDYKTNPLSVDTDSDTVSDYDEIFVFHSNPLVPDFDGTVVDSITIIPSETSTRLGEWTEDGNEIFAESRRGYLEYKVMVPVPGLYRFDIGATQNVSGSKRPKFDLHLYVDDEFVGRQEQKINFGETKTYSFLSTNLRAGQHTIRIFWDNIYEGTSLRVKSLELSKPGGPDENANGQPDWVDSYIESMYSINAHESISKVSPAQLEGKGRYLSKFLTSFSEPIQHSTYNRWFADIKLSKSSPTDYVIEYEHGLHAVVGQIVWSETNVLDEGEMTVRQNASMLLNAVVDGDLDSSTVLTITRDEEDSEVFSASPENPHEYKFTEAGTYTVKADYTDSEATLSKTLTVHVVGLPETDAPFIWMGKERFWDWDGLTSDVKLEATGMEMTPTTDGYLISRQEILEDIRIVARLGDTGPIIHSLPTKAFWLRDVTRGVVEIVEEYSDGAIRTRDTAIAYGLPDDLEIKVSTISGVTFLDGSRNMVLTKEYFNDLNLWEIQLIRTPDRSGSMCHWYKVHQNGVFVGQQNK